MLNSVSDQEVLQRCEKVLQTKNCEIQLIERLNSKIYLTIYCKNHQFTYRIDFHSFLRTKRCCAQSTQTVRNNLIDIITKFNKVHGEGTYDYSKFELTIMNNKSIIICPKHGKFSQSATNHILGQGCPECGKEKCAQVCHKNNLKKVIPFEKMLIKLNQTHNNRYRYIKPKIFRGYRQKIQIICPDHGIFIQQVQSHLNGQGCPKCAREGSKGVKSIQKYLQQQNIQYITEKRFDDCRNTLTLPFDFYLTEYNLCIEFDGEQHFKPIYGKAKFKQRQINDEIKNSYCLSQGIELVRIPYWKFSNIVEILSKVLL